MRRKKRTILDETSTPEHGSDAIVRGGAVYVIHPYLKRGNAEGRVHFREPQSRLDETVSLCSAIELDVQYARLVPLTKIRSATYIGPGMAEEIKQKLKDEGVSLVVVDCTLSPIQQRNLEKAFGAKVIDRTGLILEIFGERAQTREGVLQVELAHLEYQKGRLVRSWTHLERQRGGLGFIGGPGESQIESDRRQLRDRIAAIKKELSKVVQTRTLHRKSRKKAPYPIVALVGYTNAGKSTLFNRLTDADVMAEDLLFATLDPTMRAVMLPSGRKVIMSDTVGFISELPTELIAAFRATLEEVLEANVVIHVRDIANKDTDAQKEDVLEVLKTLNVDFETSPMIECLNKIDMMSDDARKNLIEQIAGSDHVAALSAVTGEGVDELLGDLEELLARTGKKRSIQLEPSEGQAMAWLYRNSEVLERVDDEKGTSLIVRIDEQNKGQFEQNFGKGRLN